MVAELSAGGTLDVTGTSAIGSLTRLRAQCRAAKERLSTVTVTALPAELPNFRGDVRLTRTELDDAMGRALSEFVAVLQDTMERAGVRPADLAAVASIGGGAAIPVITTTLSEHLRVPVITTPRPALTGAIGGALRAARGPADDSATAMAPAPVVLAAPVAPFEQAPATGVALAWSEAPDVPDLAPLAEAVPDATQGARRPTHAGLRAGRRRSCERQGDRAGLVSAADAGGGRRSRGDRPGRSRNGGGAHRRQQRRSRHAHAEHHLHPAGRARAGARPRSGDPSSAPVQNQAVQQAPRRPRRRRSCSRRPRR